MFGFFFFFSSAVAKVLRHVAEGKASAQAETAEWKRKYELERARNQKLRNQGWVISFFTRNKNSLDLFLLSCFLNHDFTPSM